MIVDNTCGGENIIEVSSLVLSVDGEKLQEGALSARWVGHAQGVDVLELAHQGISRSVAWSLEGHIRGVRDGSQLCRDDMMAMTLLVGPNKIEAVCANQTAECPRVVNFDKDANGELLRAGDRLDSLQPYLPWGLVIGTLVPSYPENQFAPMVFDSANPTGGDTDLGTPNQVCRI